MKVVIEQDRTGSLTVTPTSPVQARTIAKHMREYKGGSNDESSAFLQEGFYDEETLDLYFPGMERDGLDVEDEEYTGDAWTLLHLWGYDAHTLAEDGTIS